jgi:NIPSNAP
VIVEERIYRLHPGKVPEYLRIYEAEGLAVQQPILGNLVGWYTATDVGELNVIVHMWGYADLADRAARRARLAASEEWKAVVAQLQPLIREQHSRILTPTAWSPALDPA